MERVSTLGLIVTVVIGILLGAYWKREPARMERLVKKVQAEHVEEGEKLYRTNCSLCHGPQGEGIQNVGPALSTKAFLDAAHDDSIRDTIVDGRPNTAMPAWGQRHGGPFNDQQVLFLTTYVRHWESKPAPTAPAAAVAKLGGYRADAERGNQIFSTTCYLCHGSNGMGTPAAPRLNSQELLARYDNVFFRNTITSGRPSKGMPTWGKVYSPEQIEDIVAFIRTWQQPLSVASAAPPREKETPRDARLERGKQLYLSLGCMGCHKVGGAGGTLGPDLSNVGKQRNQEWLLGHFKTPQVFVPGSTMPPLGHLPADQLEALTAYMLSLK